MLKFIMARETISEWKVSLRKKNPNCVWNSKVFFKHKRFI